MSSIWIEARSKATKSLPSEHYLFLLIIKKIPIAIRIIVGIRFITPQDQIKVPVGIVKQLTNLGYWNKGNNGNKVPTTIKITPVINFLFTLIR